MEYKYFSQADFDRCVPPCKITDMDADTLRMFDLAREIAGIPFVVNSAYRTREHELSRGRDGESAHVSGHAMDIAATDSRSRYIVMFALHKAGFTRIGIHARFIHADNDKTKADRVAWMY